MAGRDPAMTLWSRQKLDARYKAGQDHRGHCLALSAGQPHAFAPGIILHELPSHAP